MLIEVVRLCGKLVHVRGVIAGCQTSDTIVVLKSPEAVCMRVHIL